MNRPVRIANCSGFYGDRFSAAREMLAGPIDVLTGDYLAELTMLILWKARRKDPGLGYATTFLRQMEDVLGTCLERGVKIVANAGGLNPAGLAAKITELSARLGLTYTGETARFLAASNRPGEGYSTNRLWHEQVDGGRRRLTPTEQALVLATLDAFSGAVPLSPAPEPSVTAVTEAGSPPSRPLSRT